MIKTLLLVALAISAHAAAPTAVGTCTGTFTQCAQCISSAMVAAASAEVCATCNAGFSLPSTLACTGLGCTAYIANCATCAANTPTVCATCASGYVLDTTNSVCVSCTTATTGYTGGAGAGVTACTVTNKVVSATTCDTANGYVLDAANSVCVNCQTAKATAGTNTYGTALPGYQCTLSGANPNTVVASTAANPCVPKYALDKSATAVCVSCAQAATTTYLAGDANAASCSWSGAAASQTFVVGTCNAGYSPDTTANTCVSCSTGKSSSATTYTSFVAGAAACTVTNAGTKISAITSCLTGYWYDSTNSACISCATGKGTSAGTTAQTYTGFDANCAMCSAGSVATAIACTGCNAGFFLYYNGTCGNGTANDTNCQYFSNQVHCVQCRTGLATTASNACVACPANCNLCDTTGKVCSVCGTGYKLSSTATGTCVPNSANIIVPGLALLSAIFYFLF